MSDPEFSVDIATPEFVLDAVVINVGTAVLSGIGTLEGVTYAVSLQGGDFDLSQPIGLFAGATGPGARVAIVDQSDEAENGIYVTLEDGFVELADEQLAPGQISPVTGGWFSLPTQDDDGGGARFTGSIGFLYVATGGEGFFDAGTLLLLVSSASTVPFDPDGSVGVLHTDTVQGAILELAALVKTLQEGGGGGGGAPLSNATPADLGTATAGVATAASRGDHVHEMPTAADVGALTETEAGGLYEVIGAAAALAATLGTAATHDVEEFASAAQGALADSALQPGAAIDAGQIQTGFIDDSRIPASIARDDEVDSKVAAAINALLDGAPGALNTLNELAAAINDDASFASSVTTALALKVPEGRTLAGLDLSVDRTAAALKVALAIVTSDVSGLDAALAALVPATRTVTAGTGLTGGGDLSANRTFTVAYGTSSTTAAVGNDARLSDTRTPTDATVTAAKFATNVLDTDTTLAANSDTRVASQKAAKAYVDTADALLVPKSLVDAKGDVFVGTADNTVARLAVGANNTVLTADSTQTGGVKWAAVSGGSGALAPLRVDTAILGVPGGVRVANTADQSLTAGRVYVCPMEVTAAITITAAHMRVSTASSAGTNCRLGIWTIAGALVATLGTNLTDSIGEKVLTGLSVALPAGFYYSGLITEANVSLTAQVWALAAFPNLYLQHQGNGVVDELRANQTYGTLPSTLPTLSIGSNGSLGWRHWVTYKWT